MLRIIIAVVVFTFALPNVAFCDDGAATPSDGEIATQASATIKVCLDFVDAKVEEENVARQKNAENDTAETVAPDATKGEQKTTPEAFLETAAKNKPHYSSENCIGIVAEDCMADEGGYGTLGMAECYGRESEAWDVRLNASFREQTSASLKTPEEQALAKHLRIMQTAWIAWRDATCEVIYSNGIPLYGSDAKIDGVYCDMVLTARQALSLEGKMIISFDTPSGG